MRYAAGVVLLLPLWVLLLVFDLVTIVTLIGPVYWASNDYRRTRPWGIDAAMLVTERVFQ